MNRNANSRRYYQLAVDGKRAELDIYGDITSWPWKDSDVSSYNLSRQLEELDVDEICVGINSYGGEIGEGLAIYNALRRHRAKVTTRCDGFACSIASVIFMAGDERVMSDPSMLMIHNGWTWAEGDAAALRKQADDIEKITEASVRIYAGRTGIDEEDLRKLMDAETWIDQEQALDMGFATSIEDEADDKPSQSARRRVMQMLENPYRQQAADDEEDEPGADGSKDPGQDPKGADGQDGDVAEDAPDGDDAPDGAEGPDDAGDPDKPEYPDAEAPGGGAGDDGSGSTDEDEDEPAAERQMLQFLKAISRM